MRRIKDSKGSWGDMASYDCSADMASTEHVVRICFVVSGALTMEIALSGKYKAQTKFRNTLCLLDG